MPSDKEQKKSPEEEAEEKKYSFLQEKIKGKQGSRETLIKQFIRIAIYGLILGMFACLGFFALKPWMQQWFAGNAKTVMIPEDEQAAEDSEKNQEGKEDPDFYIVEELSRKIEEALQRLPDSYREAFELNRFQHMTYGEIATCLEVSSKTVDYRIQQALKLLRVELKDYLPILLAIL